MILPFMELVFRFVRVTCKFFLAWCDEGCVMSIVDVREGGIYFSSFHPLFFFNHALCLITYLISSLLSSFLLSFLSSSLPLIFCFFF